MDGQNQHSSQFHETLNFEQLNCLLELLSNYLNNNLTEHQSELNSNERFKDVFNQYFRFNGSVYTINQLMSMVRHNEKVSKISRSKSSSSSVTEHEFDHISDSFSINPNGNTIISPLLNYSEQRPIVQYAQQAFPFTGDLSESVVSSTTRNWPIAKEIPLPSDVSTVFSDSSTHTQLGSVNRPNPPNPIPPVNNRNYQEARYKTELCLHYRDLNACPHGSRCLFAHGLSELRPYRGRHPKHKTQRCKSFHETGFCNYGYRCSYIHLESPRTIEHIKQLNDMAQLSRKYHKQKMINGSGYRPS